MKRIICVLLCALLVMLCACTVRDDETITGDVKENGGAVELDTNQDETVKGETEKDTDVTSDEASDGGIQQGEADENTLHDIMEKIGVVFGEAGEFKEDAEIFADAVKTADKEKISEYTDGMAEYYSFLEDIEIASYKIYPVKVPEEVISEQDKNGMYFTGSDMYLIDFDVKKGDGDYFSEGSNIYYLGLGFDAVSGGLAGAFVPAENAPEHMYYDFEKDSDVTRMLIKEFISLYPNEIYGTELYEGRNYPDEFDFSDHVHLVTHLMARSGVYGENPPYTLEEINSFLGTLFSGNKGITLDDPRDFEGWSHSISYAVTDRDKAEGRIYGCSWAHGGTTVEHSFLSVQQDDGREIYTVQLYADYSHFAKSRVIQITVENAESDIPSIVLVTIRDDTGRNSAFVSV